MLLSEHNPGTFSGYSSGWDVCDVWVGGVRVQVRHLLCSSLGSCQAKLFRCW